jgi:polyhydroxyalkanoate synthase
MLGLSLLPHGLKLNELLQRIPHSLPVGTTPFREVGRRGSIRLLKYEAQNQETVQQPLIIIPSLINRSYVLDLLPGKSLIGFLTSQGFPVYLIDWGVPADEDRHLQFQDLIRNRVEALIDQALGSEEASCAHFLGHCLGGTLACMMASLAPQKFLSLTLLTTPIRFPQRGKLSVWAQHPSFDVEAFVEAYGHAPWALLQSTFQAVKPTMWIKKTQKLISKRKDPDFQKNFWALEIWTNDNISLLGSAYRMILIELYRRDALARGELQLGADLISLKNIQCPVLNIYAQDDHIVLPEAVLKSADLSGQVSYQEFCLQGGHVGAVLNGRSQKSLWPEISNWMGQQKKQVI